MWIQSEKAIPAWIHRIRTKSIQAPGRPPFLTIHHLSTLESSTCPNKKSCSSKNCTQFYCLPLDLLHNIGMWHAVLVHCNKLNHYWRDSHNTIQLFMRQSPKNSNMSHLTTLCITTSSNMCGRIDALSLTNPNMTTNRENKKL